VGRGGLAQIGARRHRPGQAGSSNANRFHDLRDTVAGPGDDEAPDDPGGTVSDPTPTPLTRAVASALAVGVTVGYLGSNVMPVLLDGITHTRHLSNTAAGGVGTAQLLATAVMALALTARAGRPGRVALARWGLAAAATRFAASVLAPGAVVLGATNVLAGLGLGMVGAIALAALPCTSDPDRATTITVFVNVLGVAVMVAAVPMVDQLIGYGSGFVLIALVCAAAIPLMGRLPEAPPVADGGTPPGLADLPHKARGAVLCAGTALFAAADIGLWSYAAIIGGEHVGLAEGSLIVILSLGVVAGLIGVVAAAWVSGRWRRTGPLAGFLVLGGVAKFLIAVSASPVVFAVSIAVWNASYPAIVLLLLTIGSALDVRGRWNAALGGALGLGTALGPLIAGAALDGGYLTLGVVLGAVTIVAIGLITATSGGAEGAAAPLAAVPLVDAG
jgi:predicted MFS family arabinose efflux permease